MTGAISARREPLQSEDVERRTRLNAFQLGRRIDEPFVPGAAQTNEDREILLAIDRERHRWSVDAAASVEFPELLQRFGVYCYYFARGLAGEDQIGCSQN